MNDTLQYRITFSIETCCRAGCGVQWAMDNAYIAERRRDHTSFYCPNGHSQYFPQKSDAEKEKEKRIRAEAKAARMEDQAEVAERRRRAAVGQKTKILNRIHNGVCPHCKRSFPNLLAHMETEHPEHPEV